MVTDFMVRSIPTLKAGCAELVPIVCIIVIGSDNFAGAIVVFLTLT